jgi:hypothetical protein
MTAAAVETTLSAQITVNGTLLADQLLDALVEVRVDLGLRVVGRATLRFADHGYKVLSSNVFPVGATVTVGIRAMGGGLRGAVFEGEVTGVTVEQRGDGDPDVVIVCQDGGFRLARTARAATYLQMSYSAIVAELAQGAGLTCDADATSGVQPYVLQAESDLSFIDSIAARLGYDWWFVGKKLHFKRPAAGAAVALDMLTNLTAFSVRASATHPTTAKVKGWNRDNQAPIGSEQAVAAAPRKPTADLLSGFVTTRTFGQGDLLSTSLSPADADEATTMATALRDAVTAQAVVARGETVADPRIAPRAVVTVANAGPMSGSYDVTAVEHVLGPRGFVSRFTAGERRPTSLADTLGGAPHTTGSFSHPGLVIAVVSNLNDPERRGRVKVTYAWLGDQVDSAWARVATVGGGSDRGFVSLPEVNDEVIVGFEGGDPRRPVILGGVFNTRSKIPQWDVENGKVTTRRITSRLGHVIELSDGTADTAQHVAVVLAGKNHKLRLGKDRVDLSVPAGTPLKIDSGQASIEFTADGSVVIKGTKVTIQAQSELAMSSSANASLKASAQLAMEGSAQAAVKGGMVEVSATGIAAVKGGMVQIN